MVLFVAELNPFPISFSTKTMYGKIYPSLYSGSMIGAGPVAFALWPYIITNARPDDGSLIDLNPDLISAIIGCKSSDIQKAIDFFCEPDERSRTPAANGCRLIKKSPLTYFVVNLEQYRFLDDCDDRRTYWRDQKEKQRQKRKIKRNETPLSPNMSGTFPDKIGLSHLSPNADADADADADAIISENRCAKDPEGQLEIPKWVIQWSENSRSAGSDYTNDEARLAYVALEANGWKYGNGDKRAALENQIHFNRKHHRPSKKSKGPNL